MPHVDGVETAPAPEHHTPAGGVSDIYGIEPGAGAAGSVGALRSHHVPRLPEAARAAGVPLLPAAGAGVDQRPLHGLRGAEFDPLHGEAPSKHATATCENVLSYDIQLRGLVQFNCLGVTASLGPVTTLHGGGGETRAMTVNPTQLRWSRSCKRKF